MMACSDIDKALTVYRDILGYDTVVYDKNGTFSDWQTLRGGTQHYRRVLLSHSQPFQGPFAIDGLHQLDSAAAVQFGERSLKRFGMSEEHTSV